MTFSSAQQRFGFSRENSPFWGHSQEEFILLGLEGEEHILFPWESPWVQYSGESLS